MGARPAAEELVQCSQILEPDGRLDRPSHKVEL